MPAHKVSVPVPSDHPASETAVHRSPLSPGALVTRAAILDDPARGIGALLATEGVPAPPRNTVYELMLYAAIRHRGKEAIGYRDVLAIEHEKKGNKTWSNYKLSPYKWLSMDAFEGQAWRLGEKLVRDLGYGDRRADGGSRRMLMFANSSHEWLMTVHACFSQSIGVATIYTALGVDGLTHAAAESQSRALSTTPDLLPTVLEAARSPSFPRGLRDLILGTGDAPPSGGDDARAGKLREELRGAGWRVHDFADLVGAPDAAAPKPPTANLPEPGDEALIMYTSGTSGEPKGIILTHAAICAVVGGADLLIGPYLKTRLLEVSAHYAQGARVYKAGEEDVDVYAAFLPTSHILEFVVEHVLLFLGVKLGTARVRTLLGATVAGCKPDLQELRPTVMAGVPTIWERIRKTVDKQLSAQSRPVQALFQSATFVKRLINTYDPFALVVQPGSAAFGYTPTSLARGAIDALVFAKVRAVTGGRLRACLSGGAPMSPQTRDWISTVVCPVIVGYGLTETGAVLTFNTTDEVYAGDPRSVGGVAPHVEVKLVDFEEGGYLARDGRGEIWARGPGIMREYFGKPDLTAETLTEDGWLKTGDIGEWLPNGALAVIDRKKNLIKLSHGEYIAVERLESLYGRHKLCHNVCVYAHPSRDYPIALLVPDEKELRALLPDHGEGKSLGQLCHDLAARRAALGALKATAKEARMSGAEVVKAVVLAEDEWTPENGLMTPSAKVKRREIEKRFAKEIEGAYAEAAE